MTAPALLMSGAVAGASRAALRGACSPMALSVGCRMLFPLLGLIATPARAIDYYWDINGATAGSGGPTPNGTWQGGGTTLSTDPNGTTATGIVTTTTADRVFFSAGTDATGSYTVTVSGTQNIGRLTFQEGTVNVTGGTINFGAVSGLIDGDATGDTISSVISGTAGVRHSGGTRTLTGTNTYTGTTQLGGSGLAQASVILAAPGGNAISGSVLALGAGGNYVSAGFVTLGAANQINDTATVTMQSGHYSGSSIFSLNGFNETVGGINLAHAGNGSSVTFRNGAATDATVTLAGSGTYTTALGDRVFGRDIVDGGAGKLNVVVALTGVGIQTFSGQTPRYTGTTTVNSGTLMLWNTSLWASNTTLNGGTLQLHQTLVAPVTAGGNAPSPRTHANTIAGTGGTLLKTGDGTVILSGINTYQGATTINAGTLQAGSTSAFGINSAVTLANVAGATLNLNGFSNSIGSLAGGGATGGNVVLGAATLTTGGDNASTTYGGIISGTGGLIKTGLGSQALTGANTYSGGTVINAGTLQLGNGGTSGSIVGNVTNNGTLAFNRSDVFSFSGIISGSGAVAQAGTGTTILTATNSHAGGTFFNAGILQVAADANLGAAAGGLTFNGGTLQTTANFSTARNATLNAAGGTILVDSGTVLTDGGTIAGAGPLTKGGSGTLILTGNNTYAGATNVQAGSLIVNGDQSGATGQTNVASGSTLGGVGIIGGSVVVASGGTLSPGTSPGTLTINGNLVLNSGSVLAYEFGQANVPGGPLNDLTNVGGSLTLAGTLNVTLSPGGSFDVGVYRIFNYGGTLTNNGLTIGAAPPAATMLFVQTSVTGQVNLVNTTDVTLSFWDGATGPKNNGVINGGSGTWHVGGADDNWTDASATINAPYSNGAFAVFQGQAGMVTVDNSLGQVQSAGMQFATDGYVITGGPLALVETLAGTGATTIRVGDGTSAGAGMTATIDAVLGGTTRLVKTDLGTLVLGGNNTYTGGTEIQGGTLRVSSDASLGAASGGLTFDGGTLQNTAAFTTARVITINGGGATLQTDADLTVSGAIGGAGRLAKTGTATLILTSANTYTGGTTISAGTLQLGTGGTSGSIVGDVINNGALVFNRSDTFVLGGAISGSGVVNQGGSGTTVLTGNSTYTGGTTIASGTLQLGDGGTSGAIVGNVLNSGVLAFNRSNTLTFGGVISGSGVVNQDGSGATILTAVNPYTGATNVNAGTLALAPGAALSGPGTVTVAPGATLGGYGSITGTVVNNGTVAVGNTLPVFAGGPTGNLTILSSNTLVNNGGVVIGASGTPVGNTLTTVSYVGGAGSTIRINTVLAGDGAPSDRLIVNSGTATGASGLIVTNVGGGGALTTGNGIQVVSATNGATTAGGSFTLAVPAVAGPYDYLLFQGGRNGSDPQSWFLRSTLDCTLAPNDPACQQSPGDPVVPSIRPEVSLYTAIPSMALLYGRALMGTLHQRSGEPQPPRGAPPQMQGRSELSDLSGGETFSNGWGRILMQHGRQDGGRGGVLGSDGPKYNYDLYALQVGTDVYRRENSDGSRDHGGAYVGFGQIAGDVRHFSGARAGRDTLQAWSAGLYWTHFGAQGWYIDAVAQGTWYDARSRSSRNVAALKTTGFGLAASLEGGYPIALKAGWTIEPQAQLLWQRIWLDSANDGASTVRFSNVETLTGRLGARLMTTWQEPGEGAATDRRSASVWLRANLWHEFRGKSTTTFSSAGGPVPFRAALDGTSVEFSVGVTAQFTRSTSFFASAGYHAGFDRNAQAYEGRAGLRITW